MYKAVVVFSTLL